MNAYKLNAAAAGCLGIGAAFLLALAVAFVEVPAQADTLGIFDPATLSTNDGRQIFEQICQGCHMPGGQGAIGAGHFPALANDRSLASRQYMVLTILTGRRNRIRTLRQGGGLSGFTKRSESEYDPFGAAHSSTSISSGLGMAGRSTGHKWTRLLDFARFRYPLKLDFCRMSLDELTSMVERVNSAWPVPN